VTDNPALDPVVNVAPEQTDAELTMRAQLELACQPAAELLQHATTLLQLALEPYGFELGPLSVGPAVSSSPAPGFAERRASADVIESAVSTTSPFRAGARLNVNLPRVDGHEYSLALYFEARQPDAEGVESTFFLSTPLVLPLNPESRYDVKAPLIKAAVTQMESDHAAAVLGNLANSFCRDVNDWLAP
jgi:hypothetical protein